MEAPVEGAATRLWAHLKQEQAAGRKRYALDIVIYDQHTRRQANGCGLVFVPNQFEAELAVAASRPSQRGNLSLLDDLLHGLSGNVVNVDAAPVKIRTLA